RVGGETRAEKVRIQERENSYFFSLRTSCRAGQGGGLFKSPSSCNSLRTRTLPPMGARIAADFRNMASEGFCVAFGAIHGLRPFTKLGTQARNRASSFLAGSLSVKKSL